MVRWMAHWIAELMERAETAETAEDRRDAQARCADAIQTLWSRRQHWPYGAPLERVAESLSALAGQPERFEQAKPSPEAGWAGAMDAVDRLGHEEWEIVRQAAIAEIDLSDELAALEADPESLDEKEREIIETLGELQDHQKGTYFDLGPVRVDGFGTLDPEEKAEQVRQALAHVAERREAALARAEATSPLGTSAEDVPDSGAG